MLSPGLLTLIQLEHFAMPCTMGSDVTEILDGYPLLSPKFLVLAVSMPASTQEVQLDNTTMSNCNPGMVQKMILIQGKDHHHCR